MDTNKTIELFGAGNTNIGESTIALGIITNCHQDAIFLITNVTTNVVSTGVGGFTNYIAWVWSPIGETPQLTATNYSVYCIYGTNNVNAFAACIAACSTNATVYIPHGTVSPWGTTNAYLMIPYQNYTNYNWVYNFGGYDAGIILTRGGLAFVGDGQGQSILMCQGAFKNREADIVSYGKMFGDLGANHGRLSFNHYQPND